MTVRADQAMITGHQGEAAESASLAHLVLQLCASLQLLTVVAHRGGPELPPRQRVTLQLLVASGPARVSDLAQQIGVSNPTMTGILDRLEARGLIIRERDQRDRRVTIVRATASGAALITREAAPLPHLRRALERLAEQERAEVARSLQLLIGAISTELPSRPAVQGEEERMR